MEENNKIEEKVTDLINKGDLKMRPKWYFSLKAFLSIFALGLLFLFMIYILSLIDLILDDQYQLRLSKLGIIETIVALPWLLVLTGFVMLFIFDGLLKKYSFSYKNPFVYTFLTVLILLFLAGTLVHFVDKDKKIPRFGESPEVPVFGPLHKYYRGNPDHRPKRGTKVLNFLIIESKSYSL